MNTVNLNICFGFYTVRFVLSLNAWSFDLLCPLAKGRRASSRPLRGGDLHIKKNMAKLLPVESLER